MMKLFAFDLSTKSTGWSLFDQGKLIKHGCITASSTDVVKRINKITSSILEILKQNQPFDKIILEQVIPEKGSSSENIPVRTYRVLMWMQAAMVFMVHQNYPKVDLDYIYPSAWRKKIGIQTGRGLKRDGLKIKDIQHVFNKFGIRVNDDEADAICIGEAALIKENDQDDMIVF